MKRALIISIIILCSACAKDHGKPIASLSYDTITTRPGTDLYDVRFTADVDLLNLFHASENPIGGRLRCALSNDHDFSLDHVMAQSARGPIAHDTPRKSANGFAFVATVFFTETLDNGTSDRTLKGVELSKLIASTPAMPCKYIMAAHNLKPYYSNTLMMPTKDILHEIEKNTRARRNNTE